MDIIIEIILEVIVGGASEAVGEKWLPLPARVAAGIALFMLAGAAAVMVKKIREIKG